MEGYELPKFRGLTDPEDFIRNFPDGVNVLIMTQVLDTICECEFMKFLRIVLKTMRKIGMKAD